MDAYEKFAAGEYENKVPFAWTKIPVNDSMTIADARRHEAEQENLRREQRRLHHEETSRLTAKLKADLENENGVSGHPKADKLWDLAWDRGHSGGYGDVISIYTDFVELIR